MVSKGGSLILVNKRVGGKGEEVDWQPGQPIIRPVAPNKDNPVTIHVGYGAVLKLSYG